MIDGGNMPSLDWNWVKQKWECCFRNYFNPLCHWLSLLWTEEFSDKEWFFPYLVICESSVSHPRVISESSQSHQAVIGQSLGSHQTVILMYLILGATVLHNSNLAIHWFWTKALKFFGKKSTLVHRCNLTRFGAAWFFSRTKNSLSQGLAVILSTT